MSISSNITEGPSAPPIGTPTLAEFKAGPRRRQPTHPGAIARSNIEALGMSVNAVALAIGVTRAALGNIVAEKSAISPDMAQRLGRFFDNGAELWLRMQMDHDLWESAQRLKDDLAKIEPPEWDREEIGDE